MLDGRTAVKNVFYHSYRGRRMIMEPDQPCRLDIIFPLLCLTVEQLVIIMH